MFFFLILCLYWCNKTNSRLNHSTVDFILEQPNPTKQNHMKKKGKILWICSVAHSIHVFRPVEHAQFNRIDMKMVNCSLAELVLGQTLMPQYGKEESAKRWRWLQRRRKKPWKKKPKSQTNYCLIVDNKISGAQMTHTHTRTQLNGNSE